MKRIIGFFMMAFLFINGISSAATSTEVFDWAFESGIITSYKIKDLKNTYLTREMVAPFLVNYIDNVARKGYTGKLCKATDIKAATKIYQDDLEMLCNFGILRGSKNKISPKRILSKQEAIALVMRIKDGEQKEKKEGHRAYHYYERAEELGFYGVPNINDDKNTLVTIEEFIQFLYSVEHPYETTSKSKDTNMHEDTNIYEEGSFETSDDALLKLLEIFKD